MSYNISTKGALRDGRVNPLKMPPNSPIHDAAPLPLFLPASHQMQESQSPIEAQNWDISKTGPDNYHP